MANTLKIALLLTAMDKASAVVGGMVAKTEAKLKGLQKFSGNISNLSNKALLAGGIGAAFFGKTIEAAEDNVVANNRLRQVFKSMGQDYEKASKQAADYAGVLEFQIGKEDEAILAVQAKIATFARASNAQARMNGIFQRATAATFDMEAAGFGEASMNAVQLGKALQDPLKGLKALGRSGITFTSIEQAKIKALIQSGKLFAAQNIVMTAIEKQVGGVAKTTAKGSTLMKVAWSEVMEQLGHVILPTFNKVAQKVVQKIIPAIQGFIDKHPALVKWVAAGTVGLLALGVAGKILAFTISGVATALRVGIAVFKGLAFAVRFVGAAFKVISYIGGGPVLLIIAAVAVAALLIIKYWTPIKAFFIRLWTGIKAVFTPVLSFLWKIIYNFTPIGWFIRLWKPLSKLFGALWQLVKAVFHVAIGALKYILLNFTPIGLIYKHWEGIKGFFVGLWDTVKAPFIGVYNWVMNFGKEFYEAGANIISSIIKGITSKIEAVTNVVKNVAKKIRDFFPFSPAKTGPLRDIHRIKLMETIAASINAKPLINAVSGAVGAMANGPARPVQLAKVGGGAVTINYQPTVNGSMDAADMRVQSKEMFKMFNEEMRKRDRTRF